jgi:multidrug efflux pump subunit AcrB
VVAEFELDVDIKTAIQDVRDKVAEARRQFNRDVGEPTVSRADNDNDQPVLYLSMRSDARSLREVSDLAELLVVKRLQGAQGVGNIEVNGSVQRELAIRLKPEMMAPTESASTRSSGGAGSRTWTRPPERWWATRASAWCACRAS